jgi:hypothetical protein
MRLPSLDGVEQLSMAVEYEERYWYPDDGDVVWIAGYQLIDRDSGRYLAREAPELAARGLRVAGVAGAGRHHADALASDPGRAGAAARAAAGPRQPARSQRHRGSRRGGPAGGLGPARAGSGAGTGAGRRTRLVRCRAARAATLAARPPPWSDDVARSGGSDRAGAGSRLIRGRGSCDRDCRPRERGAGGHGSPRCRLRPRSLRRSSSRGRRLPRRPARPRRRS